MPTAQPTPVTRKDDKTQTTNKPLPTPTTTVQPELRETVPEETVVADRKLPSPIEWLDDIDSDYSNDDESSSNSDYSNDD